MITPVNGHVLIEPIAHDSFIASQTESYQEIGTVIAAASDIESDYWFPEPGEKVYFDAWLAAKYPKGTDGSFYWLVKWEDVRAVEGLPEDTDAESEPIPE